MLTKIVYSFRFFVRGERLSGVWVSLNKSFWQQVFPGSQKRALERRRAWFLAACRFQPTVGLLSNSFAVAFSYSAINIGLHVFITHNYRQLIWYYEECGMLHEHTVCGSVTSSETPCSYNVRLGSRNWLYDKGGNHLDVSVQAIYRHPDYSTCNWYISTIRWIHLS